MFGLLGPCLQDNDDDDDDDEDENDGEDDDDDDDDDDEELGTAALIGPGKLQFVGMRYGCSLHYGSSFCVVCF